jgi:hypothetical protein
VKRNPVALEIKTRIDKWYCTKLKGFCTSKEPITRTKKQHSELETIFVSYSLDTGLISRTHKDSKKS